MSNSENIIGKNIKTLRQKKLWNQSDMAKLLNISSPAYSKIENGLTDINIARLHEIADIFNVAPSDLFYEPGTGPISIGLHELDDLKSQLSEKDNEVIKLQKKLIELFDEVRSMD